MFETGEKMKRERELINERRRQILVRAKYQGKVFVDLLSEELQVSPVTIRRDLAYLEKKQKVARFYGGAAYYNEEDKKESELDISRKRIAEYAAELVNDGDSIFINTSNTALKMLNYVTKSHVTVITNNGKAIQTRHGDGVSIILTGGELRHPKEAMVGDFALQNIQNVFPNKAFIGCNGISAHSGMTTQNASEVKVNQMMIQNAREGVYVLADHTKVGVDGSFTSAPITSIDVLITDEFASEEALKQIRAAGVKVHIVRQEDFEY